MPKSTPAAVEETALVAQDQPSSLDLVKEIIATIPSADEDPTPRMAEFILSQPPEKWEELWAGLPNVKSNAGQIVTVHAIRVRPSDFEGPLGVYVIADVTWKSTGERGLLSCSSQMAMLQLLRLHAQDRFPATVEIVQKAKSTAKGYHPIHLRYLDAAQAPIGDPTKVVSEQ